MNFKEWYKQYSGFKSVNPDSVPADVIDAWNACKQEVLKIIYSQKTSANVSSYGVNPDYQIDKVIAEIEKL